MTAPREPNLRQIAETVGILHARRHIFLCCDQTKPRCCDKEQGLESWAYLKRRLKELGVSEQGGVLRTKANCLKVCAGGPIAVVYPEGTWYRGCTPAVLEEIILQHLVNGRVAPQHVIAQRPLPGAREERTTP